MTAQRLALEGAQNAYLRGKVAFALEPETSTNAVYGSVMFHPAQLTITPCMSVSPRVVNEHEAPAFG